MVGAFTVDFLLMKGSPRLIHGAGLDFKLQIGNEGGIVGGASGESSYRGNNRATGRMLTSGHLLEFELEKESITAYVEQAQLFFKANEIKEEKHAGCCSAFGDRLQDVCTAKKYGITRIVQGQVL